MVRYINIFTFILSIIALINSIIEIVIGSMLLSECLFISALLIMIGIIVLLVICIEYIYQYFYGTSTIIENVNDEISCYISVKIESLVYICTELTILIMCFTNPESCTINFRLIIIIISSIQILIISLVTFVLYFKCITVTAAFN